MLCQGRVLQSTALGYVNNNGPTAHDTPVVVTCSRSWHYSSIRSVFDGLVNVVEVGQALCDEERGSHWSEAIVHLFYAGLTTSWSMLMRSRWNGL